MRTLAEINRANAERFDPDPKVRQRAKDAAGVEAPQTRLHLEHKDAGAFVVGQAEATDPKMKRCIACSVGNALYEESYNGRDYYHCTTCGATFSTTPDKV